MKKVSSNYLLNLIWNVLLMIVPIVTTPYISRVLGAENLGIYSYCLSFSTYFIIAGTLGIPTYARREIAFVRDKQNDLNSKFSEILILQIVALLISLIAYSIFFIFYQKYSFMFAICGLGIVAAIFDVSWLFAGMEEFKKIVIRGMIIKIISVASIFIFVKDEKDVYLYCLILMLANLIGNTWLFIFSFKYVKLVKVNCKSVTKHMKPALFLLLPNIVNTIYAVIDKTLLGTISNNMNEVGYYEQSQKIITLSLALVTSLGTILMPRFAALFAEKNIESVKSYLSKGIIVQLLISLPIAVGCYSIADSLVPWFFGSGFDKVILLIKIFSPTLVFMGISDLIGTQLFVATKREKILFVINLCTCLLNIILDCIFIREFASYGAAVGTLISELIRSIICIIINYNYIKNSSVLKSILCYIFSAFVMGIVLYLAQIKIFFKPTIINTFLLVIIGVVVYGVCIIALRNKFVHDIIRKIKKKIDCKKKIY